MCLITAHTLSFSLCSIAPLLIEISCLGSLDLFWKRRQSLVSCVDHDLGLGLIISKLDHLVGITSIALENIGLRKTNATLQNDLGRWNAVIEFSN